MFDQLDSRSPTPLYEQIAARIRVAVASEDLEPGMALPSVRGLASQLRVNPATVVQAYRDLESDGFVTRRHGSGTYVNEMPNQLKGKELSERSMKLIEHLLSDAARLGISTQELAEAFEKQVGETRVGETNE